MPGAERCSLVILEVNLPIISEEKKCFFLLPFCLCFKGTHSHVMLSKSFLRYPDRHPQTVLFWGVHGEITTASVKEKRVNIYTRSTQQNMHCILHLNLNFSTEVMKGK